MRRRAFIALIGASAVSALTARAQQSKLPMIGFLGLGPESASATRVEALRAGLRDLGYVEGKNIVIEFRWANSVEQLPQLAAELVRMKVDVIFAPSSTLVEPARQATKTIPIVFANHADPIGTGHVASLSRPGGNITGLTLILTDLSAKQLEMLKEVLPEARRIGVLWNPTTPSHKPAVKAIEIAGNKLGLKLTFAETRTTQDFDAALAMIKRENVGGFLVVASPATYGEQGAYLAGLALKYKLPGLFGFKENVKAGALMSYFPDVLDLNRRSAVYIDKILKGANPADLPVEQASKYELVINSKTAKVLGITIPSTLLVRADEVIE